MIIHNSLFFKYVYFIWISFPFPYISIYFNVNINIEQKGNILFDPLFSYKQENLLQHFPFNSQFFSPTWISHTSKLNHAMSEITSIFFMANQTWFNYVRKGNWKLKQIPSSVAEVPSTKRLEK